MSQTSSTINVIPDDILHEIAYYLYPVELFALRETCKRFSSMGTEHFWKQKIQLDFDLSDTESSDTEKKNWKTYLQTYRKALEKAGLVMGNPHPDQTLVKFIDPTTFIPYRNHDPTPMWGKMRGRQDPKILQLVGATVSQSDFNLNRNNIQRRNIKWTVTYGTGTGDVQTSYVMFSNMYNTFQEAVETLGKNMRPVKSCNLTPSAKLLQIAFRKVEDRETGGYLSISSRSTKYTVPGLDEI